MRIILGFKGKAEAVAAGQFFCPRCKNQTHFTRIRVARYFTFFFIPLFRVRTYGEYIQCRTCHAELRAEVAQLTREQIEETIAPWTCPSCGNRNAFTEHLCLSCGAARRPGPPPLPGDPARVPADLIMSPPSLAPIGATGGKYGCGAIILISAGIALLLCFASVGFLLLWGRQHAKEHPETLVKKHGREAFEKASKTIANNDDGVAHGNTLEARELAAELSADLDEAHKNIPHIGDPDSSDRTGGHFLVFCQLKEDSCAFLIHVPNLRHFPVEAQKGIAKICFMEACSVLKGSSAAGIRRLAVATRGALFYDTALSGSYPLEIGSPWKGSKA